MYTSMDLDDKMMALHPKNLIYMEYLQLCSINFKYVTRLRIPNYMGLVLACSCHHKAVGCTCVYTCISVQVSVHLHVCCLQL